MGLVATAVLFAATSAFEHTSMGERAEAYAYRLLLSFMSPFTGTALPVVVVDIGAMPGGKDGPTPRDRLRDLLTSIAAEQPRAIAVDIDFSPDETGWKTSDDPAFFDFCLELETKRQIPLFLAVYRTSAQGPASWLGNEKYQTLAAAGLANGVNTSRVPRWLTEADPQHALSTLGQALGNVYRARQPDLPPWTEWFLEKHDSGAGALVNYSKLDQMKIETVPFVPGNKTGVYGERLRDRLVLVGDASNATDNFVVPGQMLVVPGVYLMASIAYTLAVEPLYEFTQSVRIVLDLGISLFILVGLYYLCRTRKKAAAQKYARRLLLTAVVTVIFAGVVLVRCGSVMWLDFLLVPLALLLHPDVEEWLAERFRAIRKRAHVSSTHTSNIIGLIALTLALSRVGAVYPQIPVAAGDVCKLSNNVAAYVADVGVRCDLHGLKDGSDGNTTHHPTKNEPIVAGDTIVCTRGGHLLITFCASHQDRLVEAPGGSERFAYPVPSVWDGKKPAAEPAARIARFDCSLGQRYLKLSRDRIAAGANEEAVAFLNHAVEVCPSYEVYESLGELLAQSSENEDQAQAVEAFLAADDLAPNDAMRAKTQSEYARLLNRDGDPQHAYSLAKSAHNLDPGDAPISALEGHLEQEIRDPSPQPLVRGPSNSLYRPLHIAPAARSVVMPINFETASTAVDKRSAPNVATLAHALAAPALAGRSFLFIGHADNQEGDHFNLELSRKRASAVYRDVIRLEPSLEGRITVEGHGSREPLDRGTDAEALRGNRRLEVLLK